jgi:uncharacterized protein
MAVMKRHGLLDLNEAVQNPGKRLQFEVHTSLAEEADIDLTSPITGTIEAVSTGNALLIEGNFSTRAVVECARCGEPIDMELSFEMTDDFAVEGIPSCYASDGYAEVVCDEIFPVFSKNGLIVDAYCRQGFLLNLPEQPLCSNGWDQPCPNERGVLKPKESGAKGHPAMQALEKFRSAAD